MAVEPVRQSDDHPAAPVAGEAPRVLVVDDESVICDILRDFLEYEGFFVTTCGNGETALEALHKEPYDIILTDLKMPGMDGIELLRRVSDVGRDTMCIIMTGYGTVETAIDAMKTGAFDYILKPFKPEEVVQVLHRGLEKQRLERENFDLRKAMGVMELSEALSSDMPVDQQLALIIDLVQESFDADAAQIIIEDPNQPGHFITKAQGGDTPFSPNVPALLEEFVVRGQKVLVHGDEIRAWLKRARTAEYEVHSFMSAPLRIRGVPFGVLNAYRVTPGLGFTEGQRKGLTFYAGRAAIAIDVARMYGNLTETFTQTMEGFARALEAKDKYTHGHSDRVAIYSRLIAETMGLPARDCQRIEHGGFMHDIGKIGIRSSELNKPQKLTPAEYKMFKSHPVLGKRIIEPITFLVPLIPCVYHHHETFDGRGYPLGIGGTDIPLDARILSVADSYDAMTSDRPYRKALPHEIAVVELKRCANRQFDPKAVEAFLSAIEDFRRERRIAGLPVPE